MHNIRAHSLIPFCATPILLLKTDFRLSIEEKNIIHRMFDGHYLQKGTELSENYKLLEENGLKRVHDFMVGETKRFVKERLSINNEFYLTSSWATINKKGDQHHTHSHPNTLLSAVYYSQIESGKLVFHADKNGLFPNFDFGFHYSEFNEFNSKSWYLPVEAGDLAIFPGWLKHESTPNESDTPRVVIGANFFTRGTFGKAANVDLLEL